MLKSQIEVGGKYTAKISGRLVTVRVDEIREVENKYKGVDQYSGRVKLGSATFYDVTNLTTKRTTTFKSAAKFRSVARLIES